MVDIGGEVRTQGLSAKARPWRIGIEAPDASRRGIIQRVLQLSNQSVATSGDYRNFRVVDGVRVHHVVDPRSGKPADNSVVSVTVVHEQAMWADAYATALMVLGADAGIQMAEKLGLAVLVITKTSDDRFVERYTPGMKQFFLEFPE
jgi:thiamine biosynthesis lipoprotein